MSTKPTGKSIAAFRDRITIGARLECIENTRVPERIGFTVTVTRPGKTRVNAKGPGGENMIWTFPARVSDVVALTDDAITYRSGRFGDLITWKVLPGDATAIVSGIPA